MCGIFGWIVRGDRALGYEPLVRLTDVMSHRGPDGFGYWLDYTQTGGHQIALGHRRLSIIDMEGGAQPMHSVDERIVVSFNGEIYNYIELRDELLALGHKFRSSSDTEVLIEAYRAWGVECTKRFRGMFAFALWDSTEQCLLLARDPFGKKPLFVVDQSSALLFSSEIEPLVRYPGVNRAIDIQALEQYLLNRYVPGPATFFRSVRKLPPGCYLVWRDGECTVTRYFEPPLATTEPDIADFEEAVMSFRTAFDEAVRIRMRSDAPFGAYLSGGIDSSAVVAAMVRHSPGRVRTFSVGFEESNFSELSYANTIAKEFGTEHSELVVGQQDFLETWPHAVLRRGAPVSEASDIPILLLSRAASSTVKMVLTGEGSDELLGGYPKHRAEGWVNVYQRLIGKRIHDNFVAPAAGVLPYNMRRIKVLLRAAGERNFQDRMRVWFGGVSTIEHGRILGRAAPLGPIDRYPFAAATESSLRRILFFDQTSWLPDNLLERGDRMMMAGSIEGRMPFMDVVLASVIARFPDKFLIGGRGGKVVLRAAMEKVLGSTVLNRKKVGFRVPFDRWFRESYRELVRDMLQSDMSQVCRICDKSAIGYFVDEHLEGKQNNDKILWSLMNLEMFLRQFRLSGLESVREEAA